MGDANYLQESFLGGEWSQSAQGRISRPDYRTAMNKCLNGIPIETGAWARRPGTMDANTTRNGQPARVLEFAFKQTTPYTMEFTDGHLRLRQVKPLVTTNDDQVVASISTANPAKVATAAAHGWSSLDQVAFSNLGTYCPLLQNRLFVATVTSTTEFTLTDPITGATIDGSTLGTIPTGAIVSRVLDIATPYGGGIWSSLRSVQAETQAILLQGTVAPQILNATPAAMGQSFASFELDVAVFKDGPYLDPVKGGALVTPNNVSGSITITLSFPDYVSTQVYSKGDFAAYSSVNYQSLVDQNLGNQPDTHSGQWKAVSAGIAVGPDGFTGTDFGRMIRLFSEPPIWDTDTTYAVGNVVAFAGTYWTALAPMTGAATSPGTINPNQPGNQTTTWAINAAGAMWSWGRITGFSNQISQTLSGATNIGSMTLGGGLAAAFDGNTAQPWAAGAYATALTGAGAQFTGWVGRNFASASDQIIASATIYPSTDLGFIPYTGSPFHIDLYGSATLPSNGTDGTLIGTTGSIGNTTQAITIFSTDTSTAWKYVWVNLVVTNSGGNTVGEAVYVCELQLYGPAGTGTSSTAVTVELLGVPLLYTTPVRVWRLGLYSGTTGYPTTGTYHEGRLWLAGVTDNRLDGSVPNDLFNFAPTESDGTVTDANAPSYTLNAPDVNAVFWMIPDQQGIIIGTQGGEWLVQASSLNSPLTPVNMQAHRVTTIGCADIEPRRTEHTLVFVQKHQRKVMEYFSDVFSGKFSAPNLGQQAKHLMARGIEELAYQKELSPIIWARCTDGSLIGASYKRDSLMSSQGPTFVGWHQHILGSGRVVESICAGPSVDGTLDTLTMVTNDPATNIRHVEILTNLFEEGDDLENAWQLDDAAVPSMTQSIVLGGVSSFQLSGLWHLNGETVSVFAGGLDCGDYPVANGQCAVPFGAAGGLFTPAFVASFADGIPIVVGFTFTSDGQLVRPAVPAESGARTGPAIAKTRRSQYVAALLVSARGISFGTDFSKMNAARLGSRGGTPTPITQLYSGVFRDSITDDYSFDSMLAWRITRPYPAMIAAAGAFLQTQDT